MEDKTLLEVGDIVYLPNSFSGRTYTKHTVIRVTNTQAILNENGTLKCKRQLEGIAPDLYARRIGGNSWSPSIVWLESDKLIQQIERQELKDNTKKLLEDASARLNFFTNDQLTSLYNHLLTTLKPKEQTT